MGSAILADPAMRKMQRVRHTELYFLIFKSNAASLRLLNTIPEAHIFTIRADGLLTLTIDSLRFLFWVRQQGIDTVIDLELFSRYSALLTGLSGAVNRIGFHAFHNEGLYRGDLLTHRVAYNPHLHIAKNFIALVNAALADRKEHVEITPDQRYAVARENYSERYVRIHDLATGQLVANPQIGLFQDLCARCSTPSR